MTFRAPKNWTPLRPIDLHWIECYLRHGNALRAAVETYEHFERDPTATATRAYAIRMTRHPEAKAAIQERYAAMRMETDEVISRQSDIARGDMDDFLDETGEISLERARERKVTHLIRSFARKKFPLKSGEMAVEDTIQLYPADAAQRTMMKHLGLLTDVALRAYLPKDEQELDKMLEDEIRRIKGGAEKPEKRRAKKES